MDSSLIKSMHLMSIPMLSHQKPKMSNIFHLKNFICNLTLSSTNDPYVRIKGILTNLTNVITSNNRVNELTNLTNTLQFQKLFAIL